MKRSKLNLKTSTAQTPSLSRQDPPWSDVSPTPVCSHDSNTHWSHFWFNSGKNESFRHLGCRYFSFCSFLASGNYYLASKWLLLQVSTRNEPHSHIPTLPRCEAFCSRQEVLKRWKRGVGRQVAGENTTICINVYFHTNLFKPPTKYTTMKMS